ncbi:MAG: LPS export ABC transporter periplasmic protein LptC [Ramlibacter sp.]|nr:LPS export ABC transporter periplasmic protein LptC [Ramlibacter sp.]MBX3659844.1 LPS export ABC transporter periplasmic protein LptC [Ramlibacter sp.]
MRLWDRISIYLPIILMGVLALGTYWLVRNTPILGPAATEKAVTHEPDYFMRKFSVRSFDGTGRLKSEVFGAEAHHFPDTDTLEISQPRLRSINDKGVFTVATADRALSNADGSEVQLIGNAVVVREPATDAAGHAMPGMEFRGEFLHAFMETERIRSHKPVTLIRGNDRFTADSMDYDNLDRVMRLNGRVRGVLVPPGKP